MELMLFIIHIIIYYGIIKIVKENIVNYIVSICSHIFELFTDVGLTFYTKQRYVELLDKIILHLTNESRYFISLFISSL